MPQLLTRIAAVQKGRLQNGVAGKSTVNPRHVDFAPGLSLQIPVAADVVSVGVGVVDGGEVPAVGVQNLPDFTPRVLIIAAVDQADLLPVQPHQPDLRRTLDVIALLRNLNQFVHNQRPP